MVIHEIISNTDSYEGISQYPIRGYPKKLYQQVYCTERV
jgi:hypothetical protein